MSTRGRNRNCLDNALAESFFFKTLKTEKIYGNKIKHKTQIKLDILEYLKFGTTEKEGIPI
jgi:putative transposase